jgi:hypothetical protein
MKKTLKFLFTPRRPTKTDVAIIAIHVIVWAMFCSIGRKAERDLEAILDEIETD